MRSFLHEADDDADEGGIDLTPMLDVVFIMLIFFIVTASFVKESGFDVNRPDNKQKNEQQEKKKNILVSIDAKGQLYVNRRPVDAAALTPNIKRLYAENPKAAVVVQAHEDSTNDLLITVMDAARKAGVYNVAIAAN